MDTDQLKKLAEKLASKRRALDELTNRPNDSSIELRIFNDKGWSTYEFKVEHQPTMNMVRHQIKMEIKREIKQIKLEILAATKKYKNN